jgi:hypothetical protein
MAALRERLLERLGTLSANATMCPGKLARDCGTTLAKARADILALASQGRIILSQRGERVGPDDLKGPFRVRLQKSGR